MGTEVDYGVATTPTPRPETFGPPPSSTVASDAGVATSPSSRPDVFADPTVEIAASASSSGGASVPSNVAYQAPAPSGDSTGVIDTANLQAAIIAAYNAGSGYVDLSWGTYVLNATLILYPGVVLRGKGRLITILKLAAGANVD